MKIEIPDTAEGWNAAGQRFLPGHLGMEFIEVGPELVTSRLAVREAVMAGNVFLHAGTVTSLADTCCAYGTMMSLPEGAEGFTTIDLTVNFLGTARSGAILARATPLHQGRSTQVWDATVTNEETGRTIAQFRCTQLILWPKR